MIKVVVVSDAGVQTALGAFASPEIIQSVIADVMSGARDKWVKLAGERLHSTRRDYINGIQEVEVEGLSASVSLVGQLPNMVEVGIDAFDMHDTLLGPNVPVVPAGSGLRGKHNILDKKGMPTGKFWRTIPFSHQGPNTVGQGGGAPVGSQYVGHDAVGDAAKLGRKIWRAAQKLTPSTGMPGGKTQWGTRLPEGFAPKLMPHHTTDIYAGMVKLQKVYANATQNSYATFRRISDNVPDKFLHPGIPAAHLADEVDAYIKQNVVAAFAALLNG
jgi:hypothetical protein